MRKYVRWLILIAVIAGLVYWATQDAGAPDCVEAECEETRIHPDRPGDEEFSR